MQTGSLHVPHIFRLLVLFSLSMKSFQPELRVPDDKSIAEESPKEVELFCVLVSKMNEHALLLANDATSTMDTGSVEHHLTEQ